MIQIERIGSFGADFAELKCGGGILHEGHDEYIVTHRKVFDQVCSITHKISDTVESVCCK